MKCEIDSDSGDGRWLWFESDHGMWECKCGNELLIRDDRYETCLSCNRNYKMSYTCPKIFEEKT